MGNPLVCEHGGLKRNCAHCELGELERENAELRETESHRCGCVIDREQAIKEIEKAVLQEREWCAQIVDERAYLWGSLEMDDPECDAYEELRIECEELAQKIREGH